MTVSAFISDLGPTSTDSMIVLVSIPQGLQSETAQFNIFVGISHALYSSSGCSFELDDDQATDHNVLILIGIPGSPRLLIESPSEIPSETDITIVPNQMAGACTRANVPFNLRRVFRITFCRPKPLPMPTLPNEVWSLITMAAYDMASRGKEIYKLLRLFSRLNRPIRDNGRRNYLTSSFCGSPWHLRFPGVLKYKLGFAVAFLFKEDPRPVINLCLRSIQLEEQLIREHMTNLVFLTLTSDTFLTAALHDIEFPRLEILYVYRTRSVSPDDLDLSLDDIVELALRCPRLCYLRTSNVAFPKTGGILTFPRLQILSLQNCKFIKDVSSVADCSTFMFKSRPPAIELSETEALDLIVPEVEPNGHRLYPKALKIDGIPLHLLTPARFYGIEKIIITCTSILNHLLSMEGPGLGHIEVAAKLHDDEKLAIDMWDDAQASLSGGVQDIYHNSSWKSVSYD